MPAGYSPLGSGYADALVEEGTTEYGFTFVNLVEPLVGRLQIASGTCKSATESGWVFVDVIEPRVAAASVDPECRSLAGARFTIEGGTLGTGLVAVTDGDGTWPGTLPAGDYTVTTEDGASVGVTVLVDETTFVLAVDYALEPLGVLVLSRYACVATETGVRFTVSGSEPEVGADCAPVDGAFYLEPAGEVVAAAVPRTYRLGSDGYREVTVQPGSYVLTDLASGGVSDFDIAGGVALFAVVQQLAPAPPGGGDPGGGDQAALAANPVVVTPAAIRAAVNPVADHRMGPVPAAVEVTPARPAAVVAEARAARPPPVPAPRRATARAA